MGYNKRIKFTVDGSRIHDDLENFPILLNVSNSSGLLNTDISDVLTNIIVNTELLDATFSGTSLDGSVWDTYIAPNASVSVNNALELNNAIGSAHSGASCYTKSSFSKSGNINLKCKWMPHKNHYSSAWTPRICFVNPSASINTLYGTYDKSVIAISLGSNSDTTDRTQLSILGYTASSSAYTINTQSINIDETVWHDLEIDINCSTMEISVDLDDGTYSFSGTMNSTVWSDIGSTFILAFTTSDYNKTNTEKFKDVVLTGTGVANEKKISICPVETPEIEMPIEIEYIDIANEEMYLWTKVPTLVSGTSKSFYLYYDGDIDNVSYVGYTGSYPGQQVWDSNHIGVWHLSQDVSGGTGCMLDSTINENNGTPTGMTSVYGKISKCVESDASSDRVTVPNNAILNNAGAGYSNLCIEVTVYSSSLQSDVYIIGKDASGSNVGDAALKIGSGTNKAQLARQSPDDTVDGITNINAGWFYIASNINSGDADIFVNGVYENATTSFGTIWNNNTDLEIGRSSYSFIGKIDEVRISKKPRSAGWIKTSYYSNWDNLIIFNSPEQVPVYYYQGHVKEGQFPVSRTVLLYSRYDGALVDTTVSNESIGGYYYLTTTVSGEHFIVVLDDDGGESYNALILDRLQPTGIE